MKNVNKIILTLSIFTSALAQAGVSEVTWGDPKDFRDIRPASEGKKRFQARTMKTFDKHFSAMAEQLPEGFKLALDIKDVDLAGNVEFTRSQPIRIVRQIHFPQMKFDYQLVNGAGELVDSGSVSLKDMNFLNHLNRYKSNDSLAYEKLMLDKWFDETMKPYLSEK